MSKRVGIVGAAVTPFKGRWVEKTYYDLAQWATREAVKDAQIHINDVEAAFYGIYNDIFERTAKDDLKALAWYANNIAKRVTLQLAMPGEITDMQDAIANELAKQKARYNMEHKERWF